MTDDWKTNVDRQLAQLHGDVRALLNRGVAAAIALAVMIGGLYLRADQKFEGLNERVAAVRERQIAIEGKIEAMDARVNAKLDRILEARSAPTPRR